MRRLSADFETLKAKVTALKTEPGSETLQQLIPVIAQVHELTGRTLQQLADLDGSQYTVVPGSRASLKSLSTVVEAACLAALDLAEAVADNPLDAASFTGGPPLDDAARQARDARARARLTDLFADAAHQLDVCATGCDYTVSGITPRSHKAPTAPAATAAAHPRPVNSAGEDRPGRCPLLAFSERQPGDRPCR
ncbi:hypothetical protein EASAB2608_06574 [Streptomyces sp. EAS-AB2608]|uniref:hypothetical protein n=1 Tax=Streptomyces sp. EAS-AB2608 TaxID=2779671 RepID=UPI001BED6146|nr:hypothetical protein [Streptomyces sp. EAS-AB2608]BCM71240.1 hypothetical protein EASAB2608_06574 [Streptomyces sp. EAS-AB2608]